MSGCGKEKPNPRESYKENSEIAVCCESDYIMNVRAQHQRVPVCAHFILDSVTECITWGPPDTSTSHWWNETGAELHLQPCACTCGISLKATEDQKNLNVHPIYVSKQTAHWTSLQSHKSRPVLTDTHLFMDADQLSLDSSRSVI